MPTTPQDDRPDGSSERSDAYRRSSPALRARFADEADAWLDALPALLRDVRDGWSLRLRATRQLGRDPLAGGRGASRRARLPRGDLPGRLVGRDDPCVGVVEGRGDPAPAGTRSAWCASPRAPRARNRAQSGAGRARLPSGGGGRLRSSLDPGSGRDHAGGHRGPGLGIHLGGAPHQGRAAVRARARAQRRGSVRHARTDPGRAGAPARGPPPPLLRARQRPTRRAGPTAARRRTGLRRSLAPAGCP